MTIIPDRAAMLDQLTIHKGSHSNFRYGHCSLEPSPFVTLDGWPDGWTS